MSYGYVYVASIAMGANMNQCIKAFVEAEAYDGPSLIIAYSPCINHGIDMAKTQAEEKLRRRHAATGSSTATIRCSPGKARIRSSSIPRSPSLSYDSFPEERDPVPDPGPAVSEHRRGPLRPGGRGGQKALRDVQEDVRVTIGSRHPENGDTARRGKSGSRPLFFSIQKGVK